MKPNIIQALTGVAVASSLVFIPNLAKELGANDVQIGFIFAIYGLATFISSYFFGRAADIHGKKFFIYFGLAVSSAIFFLQIFCDSSFYVTPLANPWMLMLIRGLAGFAIGIFPPALITYVYESKNLLGKFTSFNALGWAVGTFIAGLIAFYWGVFLFASTCLFVAFLVSLTIPNIQTVSYNVPFFPIKLMKKNWQVYASFILRHTGANCIWVIYPLYIASLGGDKFWIGTIYTINTVSQFLVMRFLDRFEGEKLVNTGLILSLITFLSISLAQNYIHLLPVQVLLGGSWSCLYVGSLLHLTKNNVEKATCIGILNSSISLGGVLGSLIGGTVAQLFNDFRATMYIAMAFTAVALTLFNVGIARKGNKTK